MIGEERRPNRASVLTFLAGALAICVAILFSAQVYADRNSALKTQSAHLAHVFSAKGNVSVCVYVERLAALYAGGLQSRHDAVAAEFARHPNPYLKADVDRTASLLATLADLRSSHCQDIRTLTLDLQDEPVPAVTIRQSSGR